MATADLLSEAIRSTFEGYMVGKRGAQERADKLASEDRGRLHDRANALMTVFSQTTNPSLKGHLMEALAETMDRAETPQKEKKGKPGVGALFKRLVGSDSGYEQPDPSMEQHPLTPISQLLEQWKSDNAQRNAPATPDSSPARQPDSNQYGQLQEMLGRAPNQSGQLQEMLGRAPNQSVDPGQQTDMLGNAQAPTQGQTQGHAPGPRVPQAPAPTVTVRPTQTPSQILGEATKRHTDPQGFGFKDDDAIKLDVKSQKEKIIAEIEQSAREHLRNRGITYRRDAMADPEFAAAIDQLDRFDPAVAKNFLERFPDKPYSEPKVDSPDIQAFNIFQNEGTNPAGWSPEGRRVVEAARQWFDDKGRTQVLSVSDAAMSKFLELSAKPTQSPEERRWMDGYLRQRQSGSSGNVNLSQGPTMLGPDGLFYPSTFNPRSGTFEIAKLPAGASMPNKVDDSAYMVPVEVTDENFDTRKVNKIDALKVILSMNGGDSRFTDAFVQEIASRPVDDFTEPGGKQKLRDAINLRIRNNPPRAGGIPLSPGRAPAAGGAGSTPFGAPSSNVRRAVD